MEHTTNYSQMKNNDWGFIDSNGKKASGQQVQNFIKEAFCSRLGFIYEYKRAYKYVGFADSEDFMEWYNLVQETIDSKNPKIIENNLSYSKIVEVWELPKSGVGYIWEGGVDDGEDYYGKFFGFIDEDKYNEWVEEGRPLQSDLIQQSWVSFRPRIVALEGLRDDLQHDNQQFQEAIEQSNQQFQEQISQSNQQFLEQINQSNQNFKNEINQTINNNVLGYIYEDHEHGKFLGFATEETYNEWHNSGESPQSNLILLKWNNSKEQGIPIYTKSWADNLADTEGDYIVIPDEDDVNNSNVENHTYDTSINGPLANILFSAIRQLQSEIAKIKNTFHYGIHSYSGTNTAMSRVEYGYSEDIEGEPLWAVDEEELSLIEEVILGRFHSFTPAANVDISSEDVLGFNSDGAEWTASSDVTSVTDPKIFIYITSTGKDIKLTLQSGNSLLSLDLNDLNISYTTNSYNILMVISRTQTVEQTEKGSNFVWISISDNLTDKTIAEGYLRNGQLYSNVQLLDKKYNIQNILFKNLTLSKLKIYSKYQDFSRQVIPSKPSDEDYVYKTAHITIRSVNTFSVLENIKDQLPENELIFIEDTKKLYIKNNYKLVPISGGTSEEGGDQPDSPIINNGMTQEEILQLLSEMGITTDEQNNLLLSGVTLVHQDTGNKFKLSVDSEGNITTTGLSNDSLTERIKAAFGINAESIGTDNQIRGFVGRLGLATQNNVDRQSGESAMSELSDIKLYSDRIKIGSFYAPAITNKVFGCSHCFVELENTSNKDFPLEGCYLHLACTVNETPKVYHLALTGTIPAGGTYLIRGAKKAEFNDPNTFIKVTTFDQEWYENGELLDFSHNGEVVTDSNNKSIGNDPHGFLLTYGTTGDDITTTTQMWFSNSQAGDDKAPYLYRPDYIDGVYYNATFNVGNSAYWTTKNERMYCIKNGEFIDAIYKNTFELDPAKQAYQSLNTYDSSRCRHQNVADYQYLYLGKEFIEFPYSDEKCPVSKFTPKASFEHKNVCTDKTGLDTEKPNMVTCSFGKNPYTTRCFNWVSGGLFDEYVFIKQGNTWVKFESYKAGDESKTQESGALKRKEFNNADIINCIYKRMTGRFPAANTQYTAHKCIINITSAAVQAPTEYTYIVGRADKNGNPDLEHCSEEYTFTLYPTSYVPRIYQTTDQQGFHWVEYQAWAAAAKVINNQIITETASADIIPVLVNTGDMTQSGARINEWLDYYNAGKPLFKHLEQMNVVGNNDLCGNDFNILGTGDDEGKANSYYFHVFYCYEVETGEGMIPIVNNKYVPALYKIEFNDYVLLAVNSEITSANCRGWFNAKSGDDTINIYTGWTIPNEGSPKYVGDFTTVYTMIYNMTNNLDGKELIAMCHEMPFTVITAENLENTSTIIGRWRSQSGASSLVGSHLNQLGVKDTVGTHWFSRLLEYRKCKLCIGGHKHTYAVTYPLMENYIYGDSNSKDNGPMAMEPTLQNDNTVSWISEGRNLSKFPLTTRTLPAASTDTFYPSEHVDSFYGTNKGVIYFMCQATGFKLMSNKELPSPDQTFSQYIPKSAITRDSTSNKITKSSASPEQRYPMYSVIELGSTWNIKLIRLANIQKNPTTLFTQIDHGTSSIQKQYLYDNSQTAQGNEWPYGGWDATERVLLQIS